MSDLLTKAMEDPDAMDRLVELLVQSMRSSGTRLLSAERSADAQPIIRGDRVVAREFRSSMVRGTILTGDGFTIHFERTEPR